MIPTFHVTLRGRLGKLPQNESEVAKSLGRAHCDLLFARSILRIGSRVDQKSNARLRGEMRSAVLVPFGHFSWRVIEIVVHFTCINGVVERG